MKKFLKLSLIAAATTLLFSGCATINSTISPEKANVTTIKEKPNYVEVDLNNQTKVGSTGSYNEAAETKDIKRAIRSGARAMKKKGYRYFVISGSSDFNNLSGSPINNVETLASWVSLAHRGNYRPKGGFKGISSRTYSFEFLGYHKPIPSVFMWDVNQALVETRGL